jgi:hypothetical protein
MEQRRSKKMESADKATVAATSTIANSGHDLQDTNSPKKRKANGHGSNSRQAKYSGFGNERISK